MNSSDAWKLRPDLIFLNHGSFGATPIPVLEDQARWREALERDPVQFLAPEFDLVPKLDRVRDRLAQLLDADSGNIAFVRNATDGTNAVLQSFPFRAGDEVVITDHGYNACNNAVRFAAERVGARVKVARIPFPIQHVEEVVDAIQSVYSDRTRLLVVDHVTSPTGLILPVEDLIRDAHQRGIRVHVDGAHAPGMLPLQLKQLGADYYTGNHHKWLCAPKASGFLYVAPRWQQEVRPTTVSHAFNRPSDGRSTFLASFDWCGTHDPTSLLSVPKAIEFLDSLSQGGLPGLMASNRETALQSRRLLMDKFDIAAPSPESMIGSLVSIPLPSISKGQVGAISHVPWIQTQLRECHDIEVPVFPNINVDGLTLRLSLQAYNHVGQVERLADALGEIFRGCNG